MNCPHHPNTYGLVYCQECRALEEKGLDTSDATPDMDAAAYKATTRTVGKWIVPLAKAREVERDRNNWRDKADHLGIACKVWEDEVNRLKNACDSLPNA